MQIGKSRAPSVQCQLSEGSPLFGTPELRPNQQRYLILRLDLETIARKYSFSLACKLTVEGIRVAIDEEKKRWK